MKIAYHPSFQGFDPASSCIVEGVSFRASGDIDELTELARESDALLMLATDYTAEMAKLLQRPDCQLRLIQFLSAGFESAEAHGVPSGAAVCNASNVWAPAVAEHTVAAVLGLIRRFVDLERMRQACQWDRIKLSANLSSIDGARVAILGYGYIGREIARRIKPFGAHIIGVSRSAPRCALLDDSVAISDFRDLLPTLDVLIDALPSTPETKGIIDADIFSNMKRSSYFVNVGRGSTVDEIDLIAALREGAIAGAALDVFEHEPLPPSSQLWSLDNVILSPHVAGYGGSGLLSRVHALCSDNLNALRHGGDFRNLVMAAC